MNSTHGDNTGVSQELHKQLLEFMQNEDATGIIMVGAPGTSKSMVSKAAGKAAGIPTIQFDLGAVKSSNVGASEHNMRQALNVIGTITNHAPLFLATCNSLQALSPELRRRFRLGTFILRYRLAPEHYAGRSRAVYRPRRRQCQRQHHGSLWKSPPSLPLCQLPWAL